MEAVHCAVTFIPVKSVACPNLWSLDLSLVAIYACAPKKGKGEELL